MGKRAKETLLQVGNSRIQISYQLKDVEFKLPKVTKSYES